MKMPRFYPLIAEHNDTVAWWICDGHANTEHSLAMPYLDEPCRDEAEARELSAILNENEDSTDHS